jgi:hypothetical protein
MRSVLLLLAGCWTGSAISPAQTAAPAPPSAFEITLARTRCADACPVYQVSIDGDGHVRWIGEEHVVALGERRATVPLKRVAEIHRMLEVVQFFERDERESTCSEGTSAIITVRKNHHTHMVRNERCARSPSPLDELEALIDDIARTSAWIRERVTH